MGWWWADLFMDLLPLHRVVDGFSRDVSLAKRVVAKRFSERCFSIWKPCFCNASWQAHFKTNDGELGKWRLTICSLLIGRARFYFASNTLSKSGNKNGKGPT